RAADDVLALQRRRDGLRLDGRRGLEAGLRQGGQALFGKAQFSELHPLPPRDNVRRSREKRARNCWHPCDEPWPARRAMIEHVSLRCKSSRKSRKFYQAALKPL